MRKLVALTIGLMLVLGGADVAGTSNDGQRKAVLRLVATKPLKVKGLRFAPGERVRLTATSARTTLRGARASGAGGFVADFGAATYDRCSGLVVRAEGRRGSRASLKMPQPECPPRL